MAALTYEAALEALADRGRFGIRLGLGRTRALLRELGDPQRSVRGALVAGTNGKGSVLALAGAALQAAGYRVATTPKPHLVSYRERLQIDGRPVDPVTFARLVDEILPVADRVARRHGDPTEFELLTAVVFRWFAEEQPDVALVEVGLGGRLDATHAWDGGVAAITNVALDHMEQLGPTVEAIAREKAAIIERGDVAVTGATGPALAIVRRRARRLDVPLTVVGAGAAARLGPQRHRRGAAPPGADTGRAPRAAPGRQRRRRRRRPRRARGRRDRDDASGGPADRLRPGGLAGPARARPCRWARRAPRWGAQPGRRRRARARRSATSGRSSRLAA